MTILRAAYIWIAVLIIGPVCCSAQQDLHKCWVHFTDKHGSKFDPNGYFHPKALARRVQLGLDPADSLNWPVSPDYLRETQALLDTHTATSRWLNLVVGYASQDDIEALRALPFVREVRLEAQPLEMLQALETLPVGYDRNVLEAQTAVLGRCHFEAEGLNGKGLRIAVLDAGFSGVDERPAFAHLWDQGRIVASYDFLRKRENVFVHSSHGAHVLSCIAGKVDTVPMGLATGAEFILCRTEKARFEYRGEEEHWLEAVEYADRLGADIINSSLGYTNTRYYQYEMDGLTAGVTQSARIAARLGMLVVNAAGNEGETWWQVIAAPADADSVLAVGAVDPETRMRSGFSSLGPSSDGRIKPDVAAFGWAYASGPRRNEVVPGTSFASPLIAGFAACVWQAHPDWNNMQVLEAVRKAGHLYPYYDYSYGYGLPQADRALGLTAEADTTFDITVHKGQLVLTVRPGSEPEANCEGGIFATLPFAVHCHFQTPGKRLSYYATYIVDPQERITLNLKPYRGMILRIYCNGYLYERKLE